MVLDDKQREIIENSLWIVKYALQVNKIQDYDEDLYQSAVLELIKCLGRFDESRGVKWTTFAVRSIVLYVRREKTKGHNENQISLSDNSLYKVEDITDYDNDVTWKWIAEDLFSVLTEKEKEIALLRLKGYTRAEIRKELNLSRRALDTIYKHIREKAMAQIKTPLP